jgi:hypothetical protein
MMEELDALSVLVKTNVPPSEVPQFITKYVFPPNVAVALSIILTLPMSVSSGEKIFSLLKLIKDYLRSSMSQEPLTGLETMATENRTAMTLKFEAILGEFANIKARKMNLL